MTPSHEAIFIGGPLAGVVRHVHTPASRPIYTFEMPKLSLLYEKGSTLARTMMPYIRTYNCVATTPGGVRIYEVEPLKPRTTTFTIEVEHHPDSDPELIRRVVDSVVESTPNHGTAFTGGITGARVIS